MEDEKESLKDSFVLKEKHVDMHEVAPQPMHTTTTKQEDSNEDKFWDELEVFYLSIDVKRSNPSSKEHELQQKHKETHTIPLAPREVAHE